MEFAIGFVIAIVVGGLVKGGKSHQSKQTKVETDDQRKRREADEVVAVILPTINHDE